MEGEALQATQASTVEVLERSLEKSPWRPGSLEREFLLLVVRHHDGPCTLPPSLQSWGGGWGESHHLSRKMEH